MKKIFFVGNRVGVYSAIDKEKYEIVKLMVVKNSMLHSYVKANNIPHEILESKIDLINNIDNTDFEILVSNGCPYIIPVSNVKKENQIFINIHPSLLPDLKGKHPINGAILFQRDAGATCHVMDDGIDTGQAIAQVKIPLTDDLDLGLLYRLSFEAEVDAFKMAEARCFLKDDSLQSTNQSDKEFIYYTRKANDSLITFKESVKEIMRKVNAFNISSQQAYFIYENNEYKVRECKLIENSYLMKKIDLYCENQVMYKYDNSLVIKKENKIIVLKYITGDLTIINDKTILV